MMIMVLTTVLRLQITTLAPLVVEVVHQVGRGRDIHRKVQRIRIHLKLLDQCTILRMDILRTNHHPLQLEVTNVRMSEVEFFMYFKYHLQNVFKNRLV